MADFSSKMSTLSASQFKPKVGVASLTREAGYPILEARSITTKYGDAIVLTIDIDGVEHDTFLPQRFALNMTKKDLDFLNSQKNFKVRATGELYNNSPVVLIYKD